MGKLILGSLALFAIVSLSSCKDNDDESKPKNVTAATGMRLVHSSFKNSATPVDIFIDDTKANTSATIAYLGASPIYPLSAGSHKIVAKTNTGTVVADTTMTIADATQYSFFIKDRAWTTGTVTAALKTGFVAVPDNNTTAPDAGMAKVRFVNASSGPLNGPTGTMNFSKVTIIGNLLTSTVITQSLGVGNSRMYSEYMMLEPGTYTFRVNPASPTAVIDAVNFWEINVTVEADKLYTCFATSTASTVKTPSKSPVWLTMIPN
ncbi:MAG: DUF4397 domain-containing protein [Pedobacter sp.]|nr:DUF4397 domain-containing protein [Pedobacter sp.]MDQ8052238.1 DUF4397 domain-containing protein [Pedobacter sp.]